MSEVGTKAGSIQAATARRSRRQISAAAARPKPRSASS